MKNILIKFRIITISYCIVSDCFFILTFGVLRWMDINNLKDHFIHVSSNLTFFSSNLAVYLALALVLVTTVIIWLVVRTSSAGDTVLFLGLCDSGKTSLFSLLTNGKIVATQTSINENKGKLPSGKKSWGLIDLPGHERLRSKYLYENKDKARGIVFMVDSVKFPREIIDVADFLYDVLANRTLKRNKVQILIACNKQDMATAKSCSVVKAQLEKELNNLRKTRSAALPGIDDNSSSKNAFIGKQGKDFEFGHVHPVKVDFCECSLKSANDDKNDIKQIEQWLNKI